MQPYIPKGAWAAVFAKANNAGTGSSVELIPSRSRVNLPPPCENSATITGDLDGVFLTSIRSSSIRANICVFTFSTMPIGVLGALPALSGVMSYLAP